MKVKFNLPALGAIGEFDLWEVGDDQGWPVWTVFNPRNGEELFTVSAYVDQPYASPFVILKDHDQFAGIVKTLTEQGIVEPKAHWTMNGVPALYVCQILRSPAIPTFAKE